MDGAHALAQVVVGVALRLRHAVLDAARSGVDQPAGDLHLRRLLVAGGEAAGDVGGYRAGGRDPRIAPAGEVDGDRLVVELRDVEHQRGRLPGGLVDGA